MRKNALLGEHQALNWLIWGACLVTLIFWAPLNDPFNAPKSWILSITGFWLIGWLLLNFKNYKSIQPLRWATILALIFLLTLSVAYVGTDNKYIGLFGAYQRRTGYLSYLSLIIFFLASCYLFRLSNITKLSNSAMITGFLLSTYGIAQHFKYDFVHWNNPYNAVIGTLGNPDFAAAIMAILLILNLGIFLDKARSNLIRTFSVCNSVFLLIAIVFSQARQGLLSVGIGIVLLLVIWAFQRNKLLGLGLIIISFFTGILGLIGMLNMGPLAKYFYKVSVTYRGDYWRAGWRMFIHHPFFGVGLDRYGAYFRQYRDATQSLRRGPNLTSNAAHNVPLQLAATGGIFVFIAFLLLTIFIFWRGIVAIKKTNGSKQILTAAIFASWVAYEAQSIISIDNLGIAVWGYILGGAVVGISIFPELRTPEMKLISHIQPFLSGVLALTMLTISAMFLASESSMYRMMRIPKPQNQTELPAYKLAIQKPLTYGFKEPTFILMSAQYLSQTGDLTTTEIELNQLIKSDPRYFDPQEVLAEIYEYQKNWPAAINIRRRLLLIDPYNQINLLQMGVDQLRTGNSADAQKIIPLINSFAPNSLEAKQALKVLR